MVKDLLCGRENARARNTKHVDGHVSFQYSGKLKILA